MFVYPLRVDYLANPQFGFNYSPQQVALYVTIIPAVMRLIASPVWGRIFDRVSFIVMRVGINLIFIVMTTMLFFGGSPFWLVFSAVLLGIAEAGGDIAWSLFATKIAPPDRVADYMSVHTFLTGIRGVAAPYVGFMLTGLLPVSTIGALAVLLLVVSVLLLIPTWRLFNQPPIVR